MVTIEVNASVVPLGIPRRRRPATLAAVLFARARIVVPVLTITPASQVEVRERVRAAIDIVAIEENASPATLGVPTSRLTEPVLVVGVFGTLVMVR